MRELSNFASVRGWSIVAGMMLVVGCASGANWQEVKLAPSYRPPKHLKVGIVAQSSNIQAAEAVEHLQAALLEELADHGITATFVPALAGEPSGNLSVVEWDRGARVLRWLGFGGGEGHVVVVVKSSSADGQPGLVGTVRGWVKGGSFGGSSYNAAIEAGHLIGKTIATGNVEDE